MELSYLICRKMRYSKPEAECQDLKIGNSESKYGGMAVSDTAKLKALEDENARLKRLLADTMPDNVVLKDLPGKN